MATASIHGSKINAVAMQVWDVPFIVDVQLEIDTEAQRVKQAGGTHPTCCVVPRQCYLITHAKATAVAFSSHLASKDADGADYSGGMYLKLCTSKLTRTMVPIPCHLPMGVVIDILAALAKKSIYQFLDDPMSPNSTSLLASFDGHPDTVEPHMPVPNVDTFDAMVYVTQRWKQHLLLVYRDCSPFVQAAPALEESRKKAVLAADVREFFKNRAEYLRFIRLRIGDAVFEERHHFVAFSCYLVNSGAWRAKTILVDSRVDRTLAQVLNHEVEWCYGILSDPLTLIHKTLSDADIAPKNRFRVTVLGVEPLLCTETMFLRDHLLSADYFVHVVITPLEGAVVKGREKPIRKPAEPSDDSVVSAPSGSFAHQSSAAAPTSPAALVDPAQI